MAVWQQNLKQNAWGMQGGKGQGQSTPGFKSRMCNFFLQGSCTKGAACTFAHNPREMQGLGGAQQWSPPVQQAQSWRAPVTQSWGAPAAAPAGGGFKTRLCNYFLQGLCTKGAGCSFAHGPHELSGGAAAMGKGQAKGSWMMPQMGGKGVFGKGMMAKGFMGGFAAKGMDKGKGKGKMGKGHTLPRQRVTDDPVTGEVVEWKGKYGWVMPSAPIEHEKASKHEGKIFVSKSDLVGVEELTVGSLCQFHVFTDASGLGAEECVGY
eukprot:CAMPEP_0115152880 /NCGR_PEP_ID=MMETSP0227-20121206/66404_1 /TAXON_ID=89957 /ORGANISM="Polarella glacialis, Strain CCMP 1383" /LENGTH=263 /DNA_ID=CAMNT_0002563533 /DNA_START=62 /DNA_END=853 /DNA_ORIENTATION=-